MRIFTSLMILLLSATMLNGQEIMETKKDFYSGFLSPENTKDMPKPMRRNLEYYMQKSYPNEYVSRDSRIKAIRQMDEMLHNEKGQTYILAQQPEWRAIGPFGIGGRVKAIAVHPTTPGTIFLGAAAGGIWKTINYGDHWDPIFDDQNGLSMGALAFDENNPDVMYAGTGEAVRGAGPGTVAGSHIYLGAGMYKTTDGGDSWELIGLTNVGSFSRVHVHPLNSDLIYAGAINTNAGFYVSSDAGETWINTFEKEVCDVTISRQNPEEVIIAVHGEGVYYSDDGGMNFDLRKNGMFLSEPGRISVQAAADDFNIVYALVEDGANASVYKSTIKGGVWTQIFSKGQEFFNDQGFFDNYITVSQHSSDVVLAGGIDVWRTQKGNSTWSNTTLSYSVGSNVHPDQHCAAFDPHNANTVYMGNDGGFYVSVDGGKSWSRKNNNLQISQFYGIEIDISRPKMTYGGTQDNSLLGSFNEDSWDYLYPYGDGFQIVVDYDRPNEVYFETQYGNMGKRDVTKPFNQSGLPFGNGLPSVSVDQGLFDSPIEMDPNDSGILYHGRAALYFSDTRGRSWSEIVGPAEAKIASIGVSNFDQETIYWGDAAGNVFITENYFDSFENISQNGLVNRFLRDIEPSLFDENSVYVCYSGYGSGHVFKSTNKGETWTDIGKSLPDIPCNAIALHPEDENSLCVATDIGIFITYDDGNTWMPLGRGLPRSPVNDIKFHTNRTVLPQLVLRAATHGRSMWEIDIPNEKIVSAEITSPAGGEKVVQNSGLVISFLGIDLPARIEYSPDNGASWSELATGVNSYYYRWIVSKSPSMYARIRVTSEGDAEQTATSRTFSILEVSKGSVLNTSTVQFIPYGIASDGEGTLWVTSFQSNKLFKLDPNDLTVKGSIDAPSDSLFTDLTIDRAKKEIFIHQMGGTDGVSGGTVWVIDYEGNVLRSFASAATFYPIGIELVENELVITDRNGERQMYRVNPQSGKTISNSLNPYNVRYGPRGLCYDGMDYLYQACTDFSSDVLREAQMMKIDKFDLTKEVESVDLQSANGLINCRGIEYDPASEDFWVTTYGGDIYKVAGFNPKVSVDEETSVVSGNIEARVYPNPVREFTTISFKNLNSRATVKIEVLDLMGNKIKDLYNKTIDANVLDYVQFNASDLANGQYYAVFYFNGVKAGVKKIVVIE
jgi:Secretion system C-terminal sorting domain